MTERQTWEAGELARLILTHRLPMALVDLMHGADEQSAALLLNIFVRLEVRCGGDSQSIMAALHRPSAQLNDRSIIECFGEPLEIAALRQLREVAGNMPLPTVKMWRVADTSS